MHIVVTLAERDFLYGACVLYNGLQCNGFQGKYVIGYRNPESLPLRPFRALQGETQQVEFVELDTPFHFANYKPNFMQKVLECHPEATKISYFDPDIVVSCPFSWIDSWSEGGPAACADVNWFMPSQHPTRRQWLESTGMKAFHQLEMYFNSGFLSVLREDIGFLELWQDLIERCASVENPLDAQGDIKAWRKEGRWLPFMAPDQDALNLALMLWQGPVTTLGPDVMGFAAFGELPHAIGSNKPWRRRYLLEALQAKRPRYVDKIYWHYADKPLPAASLLQIQLKRLGIRLASLIGRFYK